MGTKDPKQLIARVLGAEPAAAAPQEQPPSAPAAAEASLDDSAAADLIDLYFGLEDPAERDVVFDKLAAFNAPVTTAFFQAMMEHDEDEYLRSAASAELARRGHAGALARLYQDLAVDAEPFSFEHALDTLAEVEGPAFFPKAEAIWRDPARDTLQRRASMTVLEVLDAPRALDAFVTFVDAIDDVHHLPDDALEQAMAAFVRHGYRQALPALERLRGRIASASWADPDEQAEALAFVGEGITLLTQW